MAARTDEGLIKISVYQSCKDSLSSLLNCATFSEDESMDMRMVTVMVMSMSMSMDMGEGMIGYDKEQMLRYQYPMAYKHWHAAFKRSAMPRDMVIKNRPDASVSNPFAGTSSPTFQDSFPATPFTVELACDVAQCHMFGVQ